MTTKTDTDWNIIDALRAEADVSPGLVRTLDEYATHMHSIKAAVLAGEMTRTQGMELATARREVFRTMVEGRLLSDTSREDRSEMAHRLHINHTKRTSATALNEQIMDVYFAWWGGINDAYRWLEQAKQMEDARPEHIAQVVTWLRHNSADDTTPVEIWSSFNGTVYPSTEECLRHYGLMLRSVMGEPVPAFGDREVTPEPKSAEDAVRYIGRRAMDDLLRGSTESSLLQTRIGDVVGYVSSEAARKQIVGAAFGALTYGDFQQMAQWSYAEPTDLWRYSE